MVKMKDSGVEWIGEIPEGWEVRKVKNYYTMQTGFTPDTRNIEYYDEIEGYDWVTISDLNVGKHIPKETKNKISQKYIDEFKPVIIPQGSLLYSFKLSVGQVAFTDREVYSNEAIASFLATDNVSLGFLYYSSYMIMENAYENIYGAKLLNQDLIRNAYIIFPPLTEQRKIADFLDKKVEEIEVIIEKTKATIEDYKKYRQAIISEVVVSGLNKCKKYKDSYIQCIGMIPDDWNVLKLKNITDAIGDGLHSTPEYDVNGDIYFINGNNIGQEKLVIKANTGMINEIEYKKYKQPLLTENTIMIALNGTYGKTSFYNMEKVLLGKSAGYITLKSDINKYYLRYYLESSSAKQYMAMSLNGTTIQNLSLTTLNGFPVCLPPDKEQQEIVKYLDDKCAEIDKLIDSKEALVAELESYKKSVIYEYVTGKKEVV